MKMGRLLIVSIIACLFGCGHNVKTLIPPSTPEFADANLEAAIRARIGKPDGELTLMDLAGIDSLDARNKRIVDLAGIGQLTQLTQLELRRNEISDLTPLSGLTQLTTLGLDGNQISDLMFLSGLTQLTTLQLRSNPLNQEAKDEQIPGLKSRGVQVSQ